ncbi:MAG: glycosyltransferase family 2 protein [Bacteroidia bacterium]|nr:glycosyltransferase [Bacteroidia bacterium]MDW8015401.1 glycosyltransferase family 2 protein [Bacteroidia bacterium]
MSVVIPAKNEASTLPSLLESLRQQSLPPSEVIVVDAGSCDETTRIARQKGARVIRVDYAYPGQARNIGIALACSEIIACWDADMRLAPSALGHLIQPLMEGSADIAYSRIEVYPQNLLAALRFSVLEPPYTHILSQREKTYIHFAAGVAFRREVWEQSGGFPPWRAREDNEFYARVSALHFQQAYVHEAITFWEPSERWSGLLNKLRVYARHNLLSGKPQEWYGRLFLLYLLYTVVGISGLIGGGVPFGIFLFLSSIGGVTLMRTLRRVIRYRHFLRFRCSLNPYSPRTLLAGWALLLGMDVASLVGLIEWIILDKLRLKPERFPPSRILEELSPSLPE